MSALIETKRERIAGALMVDQIDDLPEQMRVRREKLERLREEGAEPYPVGVPRTHSLAELRKEHADLPTDTTTGQRVGVTGRVIFLRNTGKLCFATLREGGSGDVTELQAMFSLDHVGADSLAAWKANVDIGDHVFIHGEVITSRTGELSVLADHWEIVGKALRPLPVAHKPMGEETRVRQRYVDLIVRPEARQMVRIRYDTVRSLRESLHRRGFIELETPMLQVVHGGATARPFTTHINAYDMDLYLRIAPELYLKRAIVGGLEQVFEINRNFRNEGVDSSHSPEFAMLELYQTYQDYQSIGRLTREIVQEAAMAAFGETVVTHADGRQIDLGGEWRSISLYEALSQALGEEVTTETSVAQLREYAQVRGMNINPAFGHGKLVEELFDTLVARELIQPTFVCDFPSETSPLTRPHRSKPGVSEKWDLYVNGIEAGTGYSELADPLIQQENFLAQSAIATQGDPEAMGFDEDFLRALEYGMPPTGGMGMGIDRLLCIFTGRGIRETILFPLVRPE